MSCSDSGLDAGFPMKSDGINKDITTIQWIKFSELGPHVNEFWGKYKDGNVVYRLSAYADGMIRISSGYEGGFTNQEGDWFPTPVETDRWYFIASTYQYSDRSYRVQIYDYTAGDFLDDDLTGNFEYDVVVGDVGDGYFTLSYASEIFSFKGLMDACIVFNRVLSVQELEDIRLGMFGGGNAAFEVTVQVDDPAVAGTPDDTASLSITVTANELIAAPALAAIEADEMVSLNPAAFNDLGTVETYTAAIDWGDGIAPDAGIVNETTPGPPGFTSGTAGTVSGSNVYADNGIYTTTPTVIDDESISTSNTFNVTEIPSHILLYETFDDGDYDGWSLMDKGASVSQMAWSASTGVMVQSSNVYTFPTGTEIPKLGTYAFWEGGTDWSDYQTTVTIESGDDDAIGIMFRYQDENNYYRFSWDEQRNYRRLVKCVNGQFSLLAEDSVPYVTGQSYQLEVVAQGTTLQVSIDGNPVFSEDDNSLSSGTIALYCWANLGSYFDDIVVEGLS